MSGAVNHALAWFGKSLARLLAREVHVHAQGSATDPDLLLACLQPGDVLLVEGNSRISSAIKYLTQSTWSHAAMYVGADLTELGGPEGHCFVEADTVEGVRSVGGPNSRMPIQGFAARSASATPSGANSRATSSSAWVINTIFAMSSTSPATCCQRLLSQRVCAGA